MGAKMPAIRLMQIALRVNVDGIVGQNTLKAAYAAGEKGVVRALAQRAKFLHEIMDRDPAQEYWSMNWFTRLFLLANLVLEGKHVEFDPPVVPPARS